MDVGLEMLDRAFENMEPHQESSPLEIECRFCQFIHGLEADRDSALSRIKELIADYVYSENWDLSPNFIRAIEDGHPDADWLEKLAAVIAYEAPIETLDGWERWEKA